MLSVFPDLLAFSMAATAILRITSGYLLLLLGAQFIRTTLHASGTARVFTLVFACLYGISGILLLVGAYTQPAAILGAALSLFSHLTAPRKSSCIGESHLFFLLFVTCASLLFLGPGAWAVDMPL